MKKLIFLFILLFQVLFGFTQKITDLYNQGVDEYNKNEYSKAIEYFSDIVENYEKLPQVYFLLAESYRNNLQYKKAIENYSNVISLTPKKYPECYFWLGELYMIMNQYEKAYSNYSIFLNFQNIDIYQKLKSNNVLKYKHCQNYGIDSTLIEQKTCVPFNHLFGTYTFKNNLIYNGIPYLNDSTWKSNSFYFSKDSVIDKFNKLFNDFYIVTDFCELPNDTILYNVHSSKNINDSLFLEYSIFSNSEFTKPQPYIIPNCNNAKIIHPFYVKTDSCGILFFASDMKNGYGGMDIWYCKYLSNGKISSPINAGDKINSIGNEICPFYNLKENRLYFSSDWYNSLGGFDVFYSQFLNAMWGNITNAGLPINSSYNDLYFKSYDTVVFVTSNREISNNESIDKNNYYYVNKLYSYTRQVSIEKKDSIITYNFKPIRLYFDHDCPIVNTEYNYNLDYINYNKNKSIYLSQLDSSTKNITYYVTKNSIESFFNDDLDKNFILLNNYIKKFPAIIKRGDTIKIELQAFTSNRGSTEYNLALAERRIIATKNYIIQESIKNGINTDLIQFTVLSPYIVGKNIITESILRFNKSEAANRKVIVVLKEIQTDN